jgi:hypothetical protein
MRCLVVHHAAVWWKRQKAAGGASLGGGVTTVDHFSKPVSHYQKAWNKLFDLKRIGRQARCFFLS